MIRAYQEEDKGALVELLELNTPKYFDPSELSEFMTYLDQEREDYFVYELADQGILGAGGINRLDNGKTGRISWDFVHPQFHRKGIGGQLLRYRLSLLKEDPKIEKVVVRTAQFTYRYFEKFGFELMRVEEDYWSKGYHLYYMEYQYLSETNEIYERVT